MINRIRFCLKLFIVVSIPFFLSGCYLITQGSYLFSYTYGAISTDQMLKKSNVSPKTKKFIKLVNEIREFARDSIGLSKNNNYTRYVKVNRNYLVDVLSAAEELSFKQYKWCFPFFGCFPNRGFFKRKDAEREAQKLSKKGYDIIIDNVDAFSTLGILPDPVYSFMEEFSVFELASLIIHEQTHATLFLKNQLQFNEELATYVGVEGALQFMLSRESNDSISIQKIRDHLKDRDVYLCMLRNLYKELDTIYTTNTDSAFIRSKKQIIIEKFKSDIILKKDSLFITNGFRSIKNMNINNAFLAIRMTYTLDLSLMESLRNVTGGELKDLIVFVKTLKKSNDAKSEIQNEIDKRNPLRVKISEHKNN